MLTEAQAAKNISSAGEGDYIPPSGGGVAGNIVPIVFCGDAAYSIYIPPVIQSIIDHASSHYHYHIIIFDCGISTDICAIIEAQLRPYKNFSFELKEVGSFLEKYKQNFHERLHYTRAMYGRLFIPELCRPYKRVIYTDIDVVFERDIAELMEIDLGDNALAAVTELAVEFERHADKKIEAYIERDLQIPPGQPCIYSGLLVFNMEIWQKENLTDKIMHFLRGRKLRCPDQDAIMSVCQGRIIYLGQEWTCVILKDRIKRFAGRIEPGLYPQLDVLLDEWEQACRSNHAVIHYNGPIKPWHNLHVFLGAKWWHYARKTALYPHYNHLIIEDIVKQDFPVKIYRFFGFPLLTIKTTPYERKYLLGGMRIAKKCYGQDSCSVYIFGLKIFTVGKG